MTMTSDDAFALLLRRLSIRAYNVLQREGRCSAGEMRKVTPYDLLDMRGMGARSLAAVVVALNETQGAALPEWVINWCTMLEEAGSQWWAPQYAAMREKLRELDTRPRLDALQFAVIEAAMTAHGDAYSASKEAALWDAVKALIEFKETHS